MLRMTLYTVGNIVWDPLLPSKCKKTTSLISVVANQCNFVGIYHVTFVAILSAKRLLYLTNGGDWLFTVNNSGRMLCRT